MKRLSRSSEKKAGAPKNTHKKPIRAASSVSAPKAEARTSEGCPGASGAPAAGRSIKVEVAGVKDGIQEVKVHPPATGSITETMGTDDADFALSIIGLLASTSLDSNGRFDRSGKGVNAALAMMHAIGPGDPVEAMLLEQMNVAHQMGNRAALRSVSEAGLEQAQYWTNTANRWMRTFATQADTLKKLRSKGEQKVVVVHEHRHLHLTPDQASQAALTGAGQVGAVTENGDQPHAMLANAPLPALSGPLEALGTDLSKPGGPRQDQVPNARGKRQRRPGR